MRDVVRHLSLDEGGFIASAFICKSTCSGVVVFGLHPVHEDIFKMMPQEYGLSGVWFLA